MNFINNNLKKAGIFNTALIAITLVLQIYQMFVTNYIPTFEFINDVIVIVALMFALFYSFYGYKKSVAKYYKGFIILTFITFTISAVSHVQYFANAKFNAFASIARVIPIALLAFKKDFGRKNSVICALVTFILTFAMFIESFIQVSSYPVLIILSFNRVLISSIVLLFVEAKYDDKEARGTK